MKKISLKILVVLIICIISMYGNINLVVAASNTTLKNQQSQNNEKINDAKEHLEEIKEEKSEAQKQVENLITEISKYNSQIEELDGKISNLNNKIKEAENNLKKAEEDHSKQKELLEARLIAIYEAGETSFLDVLLASEGIVELISNYYLVTEIAENDVELLDKIEKQQKEIESSKQTLEESKKELDTSKASKQKAATELKSKKAKKDSYVAQLTEDEKETQKKLEQLQADNDRIAKELKAAEERYKKELEALANKNNTGSSNSNGGSYNSGTSGFLQRPVKTGPETATMYYSSGKYHGALDYGIPIGTTVYAAADGVVLSRSYAAGSYGYHIVIQHTNGLRTYYAHGNGTFYVSAGQTVSKGQAIMQSGNSGKSSGPHLHFEVRVSPYSWYSSGNDSRRDPRNYM